MRGRLPAQMFHVVNKQKADMVDDDIKKHNLTLPQAHTYRAIVFNVGCIDGVGSPSIATLIDWIKGKLFKEWSDSSIRRATKYLEQINLIKKKVRYNNRKGKYKDSNLYEVCEYNTKLANHAVKMNDSIQLLDLRDRDINKDQREARCSKVELLSSDREYENFINSNDILFKPKVKQSKPKYEPKERGKYCLSKLESIKVREQTDICDQVDSRIPDSCHRERCELKTVLSSLKCSQETRSLILHLYAGCRKEFPIGNFGGFVMHLFKEHLKESGDPDNLKRKGQPPAQINNSNYFVSTDVVDKANQAVGELIARGHVSEKMMNTMIGDTTLFCLLAEEAEKRIMAKPGFQQPNDILMLTN